VEKRSRRVRFSLRGGEVVPVLEKPHPEEERIAILILPEYESDPRLGQLKHLDDWLRRRTRCQMCSLCASVERPGDLEHHRRASLDLVDLCTGD
jgi:hypothetical protein